MIEIEEFSKKCKNFWQCHRKKIVIGLVILLLLAGWWWRRGKASQEKLAFENPQYRDLQQTLEVSGALDAKEKVRLRFLAGGKLTYLGAKEGDYIKKWQTIATIDQATLQKQLSQDLNNYLKERWDWEQTRDDYVENGFGEDEPAPDLRTRREVDKAQWDLNNEVLDVEIRDIAIQNTRLTSPIAGILTTAPTAVAGMQLLSTDYFEVVNPDTLVFKAAVDEVDIKEVGEGLPVKIEFDSFPDEIMNSVISYISYASSQSSSGTVFVVEMPVDQLNFPFSLRLGMNGDATIILAEKNNVLTVPIEATRERDGKVLVDVKVENSADENQTQEREIEIGLEGTDYLEVTGGLTDQDLVLIPT